MSTELTHDRNASGARSAASGDAVVESDNIDWRERTALLEQAIEKTRMAVIDAEKEVDQARSSLASVQTAVDLTREEIVRRRGVARTVNASQGHGRPSALSVKALEAQILAVRVAFAEAKFEKESLEAEATVLRDKLAESLPVPPLQMPASEDVELEDAPRRRSDVVMYLSETGQYRSGVIFVEQGRLVFEPDHVADGLVSSSTESQTEAHHHVEQDRIEFDLDRGDYQISLMNPEVSGSTDDANAIRRTIRRLKIKRGSQLNTLEFVGFRGAIEQIHARLASEVKLAPPSVGPSPETGVLRSSAAPKPSDFVLPVRSLAQEANSSLGQAAKTKTHTVSGSRFGGYGASLVEKISHSIQAPTENALNYLRTSLPADVVAKPISEWRTSADEPRPASESQSRDQDYWTRRVSESTVRHQQRLDQDGSERSTFRAKLSQESGVLKEDQFAALMEKMPSRYHELDFVLQYSTMVHGISLHTFYSKVAQRSPLLLLIQDSHNFVFGGFASAPWRPEKSYYGTGESFVFSVEPEFHVYKWTRANSYFQFSGHDCIAMGGGGHFAFRLDSEFLSGSSADCETFASPCLASGEEFTCIAMEVWSMETRRSSRVG